MLGGGSSKQRAAMRAMRQTMESDENLIITMATYCVGDLRTRKKEVKKGNKLSEKIRGSHPKGPADNQTRRPRYSRASGLCCAHYIKEKSLHRI